MLARLRDRHKPQRSLNIHIKSERAFKHTPVKQ